MSCGVWPNDEGPCGKPEVERLRYLNVWMDYPGHGQAQVQGRGVNPTDVGPRGRLLGLGVCQAHLDVFKSQHLLVGRSM